MSRAWTRFATLFLVINLSSLPTALGETSGGFWWTFQRDGKKLIGKIFGGDNATTQPIPADEPVNNQVADRVSQVQTLLNELGYPAGPIDGIYGPKTRGAILQFQSETALLQTGDVTASLIATLQDAARGGATAAQPSAQGDGADVIVGALRSIRPERSDDGRFLVRQGLTTGEASTTLSNYVLWAGLGANPSALNGAWAVRAADVALDDASHALYVCALTTEGPCTVSLRRSTESTGVGWVGADAVEIARNRKNFVGHLGQTVVEDAPRLPIPIRIITPVTVSRYDRASGSFRLRGSLHSDPSIGFGLTESIRLDVGPPETLRVTQSRAQTVAALLDRQSSSGWREATLVADFDIVSLTIEQGVLTGTSGPVTYRLYADPAAIRLISDFGA